MEKAATAVSPTDVLGGQLTASGVTIGAMRILGGDQYKYRFSVQDSTGKVLGQTELPIPFDNVKLRTDPSLIGGPLPDYYFGTHGRIEWQSDGSAVAFSMRGVELKRLQVDRFSAPPLVFSADGAIAVPPRPSFFSKFMGVFSFLAGFIFSAAICTLAYAIIVSNHNDSRIIRRVWRAMNERTGATRALPEQHISRTAIVGVCWIPFAILAALIFYVASHEGGPGETPTKLGIWMAFTVVPLGIVAPFITTILGWIAIPQIRRSAGKLYGMWLAVFDGLLFPLFALDFVIARLGALAWSATCSSLGWNYHDLSIAIDGILISFACAAADFFIIRRVWRAVNAPSGVAPANPPRRNRLGLWIVAFCLVLLGLWGAFAWFKTSSANRSPASLADWPQELRKAATTQVIAAGLAKPNSPWAWQELENRSLTAAEIAQTMDGLVAWMKREHPAGSSEPLSWLDNFLERLDARHLLTDDQKIRFLMAVNGNLRIEPLSRMREGERELSVSGECRYIWRDDILGFIMMNAPQSVTVDGQPVKTQNNFDKQWSIQNLSETLFVSTLPPGKHKVKIEVLSALVAKVDLTGLPWNAPPADWPPAKKRWTRTAELELNVFPRDAVLVQQTQDPALDPIRNGSLSVKSVISVIIRSKGSGAQTTLAFDFPQKASLPISFDVALRIGGQTIPCGQLWAVQSSRGGTYSGQELSADLARPAAEIRKADIILTPNPKPVEHLPSVERIWGGQIVFSNVPLKRLDLGEAMQPQENIAPASSIPPLTGGETQSPGAPAVAASTPVAVTGKLVLVAVPVLGLLLILAVLVTVLLLAIKKWKSGAGKAIAIGCGVLVLGGFLVLLLAVALFLGFRQYQRQRYVPVQNGVPQIALQTKTIVLARATNQLVGTNVNIRTVSVWSDSTLLPDEQLRALVKLPDGRMAEASSSLFIHRRLRKLDTSSGLSWFFEGVDGFGSAEAAAATAQVSELSTKRPLVLESSVPLEVFSITNRLGAVLAGYVEFKHMVPQLLASGQKAEATVQLRPYSGLLVFYTANVPSGFRLQATDNAVEFGEGGAYTHINNSTDRNSSWSAPSGFTDEEQQIGKAQMQKLAGPDPIRVVFGEPRQVFSITNKVGEIYKGFFELVGPDTPTKK